MAYNANICYLLDDGNVRLPKGRLSYASLFKKTLPKGETDQEKARFQTAIVFTEKADLKILEDAVIRAAEDKWGVGAFKKHKIKKPVMKTEDQPKMADLFEGGFTRMIRTATQTKPDVVRPDGRTPAEEDEAYSGRWAIITVNCWCYDHPTGGKGVSVGLQNVQLLDHDDRLGGSRPKAEGQFVDLSEEVNTDDIYA